MIPFPFPDSGFRIPSFSAARIDDSIHVDQVYRKQYVRNIVKVLLSRVRNIHFKTHKQKKTVWMKMLREIFLGIFNRPLSCKGPEYQRLFENHGSRFSENLRNLSSNGPTFGKKYKKGFLFSNLGIKQGKMGTET